MSYSFAARGATKAEVVAKVVAEFDNIVAYQPVHVVDREQAQETVVLFLNNIPDSNKRDDQDFYVSVSGSVGWNGMYGADDFILTSASINVTVYLTAKDSSPLAKRSDPSAIGSVCVP